MKVPVITVTQPYAELMMLGVKKFEMRGWKTTFMGELYIHASETRDFWALDLCHDDPSYRKHIADRTKLSFGAIIGKVTIVNVWPWNEAYLGLTHEEQAFCQYYGPTYNGFAWMLDNPVRINPIRRQGPGLPGIWHADIKEMEVAL